MNVENASRSVSVIVPTWNEAANLEELSKRILGACPEAEIVVVDDASEDGTPEVARRLAREHPVRLVERRGERGLATAVVAGLQAAAGEICVVLDADLSHPPEMIPALVAAVRNGAGVAVGSRHCEGGAIGDWPWHRRLTSWLGALLARPLTGIRDPMSGFFCLRRRLLHGVELRPRGFKILLEILARAQPASAIEIPITFQDRSGGESKFTLRQRKEFLQQVIRLYADTNAWPARLGKFLVVGLLGVAVNLGITIGCVETLRMRPTAGAAVGFVVAMTVNYLLNRAWTFRAGDSAVVGAYLKYGLGASAALGAQVGVMEVMTWTHYVTASVFGIATGTSLTFLVSQAWVFGRR